MKKFNFSKIKSTLSIIKVICVIILLAGIHACKKDHFSFQVQERQVLMLDALREDTSLSIAVKALEKANISATLNTYGPFTFFAPDNEAFKRYFKNRGKNSLDDFTVDEITTIMVYHILPVRLKAAEFVQGPQATATGKGDYISLDISKGYKSNTVVNGKAILYQTDLEFSNGFVHKMDGVLDPPTLTIGQFLTQNQDKYSIFIGGLQRAGLMDTLTNLTDAGGNRIRLSLFAETNDVLQKAGIQNFDNLTIDEVKKLMRYHLITGNGFVSSYTHLTTAIPGINVVERWDSTILSLDGQDYIYFDLAAPKLINGNNNFIASDIIMRNGVIHNLEKPLLFDPAYKRTQIHHRLWTAQNFCYGISGFANGAVPVANASSGNWRWYNESGHPRKENFTFMNPDGINDSLVTIVKNVRKGKYRIEVSYKNGGRGDYQLKYGTDNIGIPVNMGLGTTWEQKVVIGSYTFQTSGDKRLNFVCTRVGGINLECLVLTPEY